MSKFFVDPSAVSGAHIYMEDKDDLHHLRKVLRARPGMELDISDGDCWEYRTCLEELTEDCATLKILDKQKFATEPATRVTLYQGVPKASKMETVIQKTVEMGVDTIVPVFMERTVVVEKGNFGKKLDRWQKIAAEAVKQCKGFCTYHYGLLYDTGSVKLDKAQYSEFLDCLNQVYFAGMERVNDDIEWFINKYDYRYANEPWKNSKDAIPRGILKTNHIAVEE